MLFLYNLGIQLYGIMLRIAALFHPKAKSWVEGRRHWPQKLQANWPPKSKQARLRIWLHAASLGEFEQGRPIIEALKKNFPDCHILLSFFSPSGYEIRKDYPVADYVCYLPLDTAKQANDFVRMTKPDLAIFVKYEFWHHHLSALKQRNIPTLLVSATFRPQQIFFKPYGAFFRQMLQQFSHIFVQDQSSLALLQKQAIKNLEKAGDTRVDRVMAIAKEAKDFPKVNAFIREESVLVAGSTWPADEKHLFPLIKALAAKNWRFIIAPHEIHPDRLASLEQGLPCPSIRYSQLEEAGDYAAQVLIIDNIGMLSSLYRYGKIAYIGGGFGQGIHNILEPVAFGLPVLFGPKHQKFTEAVALLESGGAISIQDASSLQKAMQKLAEQHQYTQASQAALDYLAYNRGATDLVIDYIKSLNLAVSKA